MAEVAKTVELLALNPETGNPISSDQQTRRLLVSRFPYQIVYRRRPYEIVIVAVAHLKRKPGHWKDRVSFDPNAYPRRSLRSVVTFPVVCHVPLIDPPNIQ